MFKWVDSIAYIFYVNDIGKVLEEIEAYVGYLGRDYYVWQGDKYLNLDNLKVLIEKKYNPY